MENLDITKLGLTKYLFFTGKGGVGKTSIACAIAVGLADQGKKILLISTGPCIQFARCLRAERIKRTRYEYR